VREAANVWPAIRMQMLEDPALAVFFGGGG